MTGDFLPYGRQEIDEADVSAVVAALQSPAITTGPAVTAFEESFAAATGAPVAIACATGTAALHIVAMAADLGPGDAAIVPAVTFSATAAAPMQTGCTPVFADVDPDTGLLTAETLRAAVARAEATGLRPAMVLPVHLSGRLVDMPAIRAIAAEHGMWVVEDACHALGGEQRLSGGACAPVGACAASDMATFSFHPVKTIAMGEGGAITLRDPDLADRVRRLRSHGIERVHDRMERADLAFGPDGAPNPWYYEVVQPGFNYRVSDIACALGRAQLEKLPRFVAARRALAAAYDVRLPDLSPHLRTMLYPPTGNPTLHLYPVLIDFAGLGRDRGNVMRALAERGIGTQVHYIPLPHQPAFRAVHGDVALPGADAWYARCLTLPLFPAMTEGDVERVCSALAEVLR